VGTGSSSVDKCSLELSWTPSAAANGVNASYCTRVLRIAYLAPDIIEAITEGRHPPELTANKLVRIKNLPISWADQRDYLGFPAT